MNNINKPFSTYKWRWATLTPTESLNRPPIFLGVLRSFDKCEGLAPSSIELFEEPRVVEQETKSSASLARDKERNLIRNSGQYWRALGLLDNSARGKIILTKFGKMVSSGHITQSEFALTMVCSLSLPNHNIDNQQLINQWNYADLEIKPLLLILQIIKELSHVSDIDSYITPTELIRIVIPLSGVKYSAKEISQAIYKYRNNQLNISNFPDCALAANDKRMAREFILFLEYNHLLKRQGIYTSEYDSKYVLDCISISEIESLEVIDSVNEVTIVQEIIQDDISDIVERKRISRNILERPNQHKFRKSVLEAYQSRCLITGVDMKNVLEAAHIIPVSESGSDNLQNGICLRTDIHRLFDTGHLLIKSDGTVSLSERARHKNNYASLPKTIIIPPFVSTNNLDWRISYL